VITSTDNGGVNGKAWVEWANVFCGCLEMYRESLGLPGQPAVLFVDGAPTRGNVVALEIFRAHRVYLITVPPFSPMCCNRSTCPGCGHSRRSMSSASGPGVLPIWSHICADYCTLPEVCRRL
jgi:hypothetical protein